MRAREPGAAGAVRARRCIVTRESLPEPRLIRFVLAPDGRVVPDLARKLPGRGLWLSARRDIVDRACAGNLFAKCLLQIYQVTLSSPIGHFMRP